MLYGGGHVQDSHLFDEMRFLHRYAEVGHLCRGVAPEGQSPEEGGGLPDNRNNKKLRQLPKELPQPYFRVKDHRSPYLQTPVWFTSFKQFS